MSASVVRMQDRYFSRTCSAWPAGSAAGKSCALMLVETETPAMTMAKKEKR